MESDIAQLVDDYESGQMTRRELVAKLGGLVAFASGLGRILGSAHAEVAGQNEQSTFEAVEIDHVALRVKHVEKSVDFYQRHLGMKVSRQSENSAFLTCGDNFLALFQGEKAGLDHYCFSVKGYQLDDAEKRLKEAGLKPRVHRQGGRIYFPDPDGLTVQLAASKHTP